jgi:hypothetical protein
MQISTISTILAITQGASTAVAVHSNTLTLNTQRETTVRTQMQIVVMVVVVVAGAMRRSGTVAVLEEGCRSS